MSEIALNMLLFRIPILRIGLTLNGRYDKMDCYYSTNETEIDAFFHVKFL
jgi:hypothetical protein